MIEFVVHFQSIVCIVFETYSDDFMLRSSVSHFIYYCVPHHVQKDMTLMGAYASIGSKWNAINKAYFDGKYSESHLKNRFECRRYKQLAGRGFSRNDYADYIVTENDFEEASCKKNMEMNGGGVLEEKVDGVLPGKEKGGHARVETKEGVVDASFDNDDDVMLMGKASEEDRINDDRGGKEAYMQGMTMSLITPNVHHTNSKSNASLSIDNRMVAARAFALSSTKPYTKKGPYTREEDEQTNNKNSAPLSIQERMAAARAFALAPTKSGIMKKRPFTPDDNEIIVEPVRETHPKHTENKNNAPLSIQERTAVARARALAPTKPRNMKKGPYTPEEDEIIVEAVLKNYPWPLTNWVGLAHRLGRNRKHVRHRYMGYLNPEIDHSDFDRDDVSFCIPESQSMVANF